MQKNQEKQAGRADFYTLKKGETLRIVSGKTGVSFYQILLENPYLDPFQLAEGQIIRLPQEEPPRRMQAEYILSPGETLFDVLRTLEMSIAEWKMLNEGLDPFSLKAGNIFRVFAWQGNGGGWYIMKEGETLKSLAKRLHLSEIALLQANPNLLPKEFRWGQRIRLPRENKD